MATYLIRAHASFEASHHLRTYRGAPEPEHGHSWRVEAAVETRGLDEDGIAFDFVELRGALENLAREFDHRDLNLCPPFDRLAPSAERLAAFFHVRLSERLVKASVAEVTVWEGPDCSATYRP